MKFTRQRMCIFWPMPPDAQDWSNLEASHVRTVMLLLGTSTHVEDLRRLHTMGKRLVLRVPTGMVLQAGSGAFVRAAVAQVQALCPVDAVVVGNEIDGPFNLAYGSADWGQQAAYRWLAYFQGVRTAVQGLGVPVVSPGLTMRSISEDEIPQPGRVAWNEITRLEYDQCDLNGVHIYGYWWRSDVDRHRFKWAVKQAAEWHHKMLFLDEVGIPNADNDMERMNAYIEMARILEEGVLGERVALLCFFTSNGEPGDPPAWDPRYKLRDPAAYALLGTFMQGKP